MWRLLSSVVALVVAARANAALNEQPQAVAFGLDAELARVQSDHDAVQQLADVVRASSSSSSISTKDALVQLGNIYFYGNSSLDVSVNGTLAMKFFSAAATQFGDAHAQFHVGVAHSYGFWGFEKDNAAAMLQYYFASLGEHTGATLALGFKHLTGVGAPKSCESAVRYYEVAANKAVMLREANASKPAIYDLPHRRLKTVSETQHKKNIPSDAAIVDYYQFSADKGDPEATMNLATLFYYGARGLEQDLVKAAALFQKAYELGASGGAYQLGHIYSHGIGVKQDNDTAFRYLQEASNEGNTQAQNELAYMYLQGKGTPRDPKRATTLFQNAAKQGSMEAFYNLGVLHMKGNIPGSASKDPEYEVAHGYFQVAAHQGHTISSHKLGHMSLHGIGTTRSCRNAVDSFKLVAERGEWDRMLLKGFKDFKNQDYEAAFLKYAVMAQQGYEVAQHNAAYLLDYGFLTPLFPAVAMPTTTVLTDSETSVAAMMLYKLAALQGNVDANLKIGDFYYYGKGGHAVDFTRASAHYSLASKRANAQAMFNLGLMYEHGIGVDQDFYLAKRYFDKAKDAHSDAHVPVTLALWKLSLHTTLTKWKTKWDILVGNIEAPPPLAPPPPPARPASSSSTAASQGATDADATKSYVEALLESWWPSIVSGADSSAAATTTSSAAANSLDAILDNLMELLQSDDFLILVLMVVLGVVLYIRSERQYLGDPMPQPVQQQQQQQQVPQ
ncbi:Sel-1 family protein, partial [Globisporangium splendens]